MKLKAFWSHVKSRVFNVFIAILVLAYLILPLDFKIPVPFLSISLRSWRLYTFVLAIPLGLGALMIFLLHESPKFLASQGYTKEALEVLRAMYKTNGGNVDDYAVWLSIFTIGLTQLSTFLVIS